MKLDDANKFRDDAFKEVVKIGKAVSNVPRLKILSILNEGSKSVEEIAKATGLTVVNTSKNLQLLKKINFVKETKKKNYVFYELGSPQISKLLWLLIDIGEESLEDLNSLEENLKVKSHNLPFLNIEGLNKKLNDDSTYVLDIRPEDEFNHDHLPKAHNIPYNQIDDNLHKIPEDKNIIVYCRGRLCGYSEVIGEDLLNRGYKVEAFNNTVSEWREFNKEDSFN